MGDKPLTANIAYPNGPVYSYAVTSTGSHLFVVGSTGGNFTASASGQTAGRQSYGSSAGASISVDSKSRSAKITSSIEPTWHKVTGNIVPQLDIPGPDGTMTVNTLAPDPSGGESDISYIGFALGIWASGSTYNMFSAIQS